MEFYNCNFELLFNFYFNIYCKAQLNIFIETAWYKFKFIIIKFIYYLLLLAYFLYSTKGTVFLRPLVCFYLVIHFISILCWSTIDSNTLQLLFQFDGGGTIFW